MKPDIRQTDDELIYTWPELGVGVALARLRETASGSVKAWLTVESTRPEASGHIYWAQVTVTGAADRNTLVRKLDGFAVREAGAWERDVDRVFHDAVERYLTVPEAVDLADVEAALETDFLYAQVVPAGQVTLLLADQGSTKSYLMEYLALCACSGHVSVFGAPALVKPVVYFDWEVDERVARRRLDWICRGLGLSGVPRGLHYLNMSDRGRLVDRIRDMRHEVARLGAGLVIIDSLTFATGGDLNSAEFSAPTMSAIGSLGDGITKLVSAHPNKASRNGSAEDISVIGSGLFEFRARAIWLMQRERDHGQAFNVSMRPRKPFDGMPRTSLAYRVRFENEQRAVHFERARIEDSAELAARSLSLAERIRLALRSGSANTQQLANRLGTTTKQIGTECNRMPDVIALTASAGGPGNTTVWGLRNGSR